MNKIKVKKERPINQIKIAGTEILNIDLISRQAVIDEVQNRHIMLNKEKVLLINDLEKLPSIQPEIVRCEECKYHYQRNCPIEKYFSLDGFCSRGKRREVTT